MFVSTYSDLQELLDCDETLLAYLQYYNLIINDIDCVKCLKPMNFNATLMQFRCTRSQGWKKCNTRVTMFFSKLPSFRFCNEDH